MKYSAVRFSTTDIHDWQKDLLIHELGQVGFDTFEDTTEGFDAYIPSANLNMAALEIVLLSQVEGYHLDYRIDDLDEQNWNVLWESNFEPIVVDERCYVRATFHPAQPEYAYEIVIDPKMAFGTGHHQTTSMMLSFVLENDFQDKDVLDMGCGTGILSILASMRGAARILAVDYDPICVDSVTENKQINGISNIEEKQGSKEVIVGHLFDVVLANINRNILLDQMESYEACMKSGGELYLSGFYAGEDLNMLRSKCSNLGLYYIESKVVDNWCAAKFRKG